MTYKNKDYRRSHISEAKFRQTVRYFCLDFTASATAELAGIRRPTINKTYQKIKMRVAEICEAESPLSGEIEVDESKACSW